MFLCLWRALARPPKTQKHLEFKILKIPSRMLYWCKRSIQKTRSDSHDHRQEPEGQIREDQRSGPLLRNIRERAAAGDASRRLFHHRGDGRACAAACRVA